MIQTNLSTSNSFTNGRFKKKKHKKCGYLSVICRQMKRRTRPRVGEGDEQRPRVGEEDELGSCRQTKRRTRPRVGEGDELGS